MKKLVGFLIIMLFTTNLFGQSVFSHFNDEAENIRTGNGLREHHITTYTTDWCPVTYQFIANGKQYFISYENTYTQNGETKYRNLYLYRWDSIKWNIAIDKPLRIDHYTHIKNSIYSCECYFPQMYGGNWFYLTDVKNRKNYQGLFDSKYDGYIKKLNNGNIEIKLTIYNSINEQQEYTYHSEIIILKPCGNNNYKIK